MKAFFILALVGGLAGSLVAAPLVQDLDWDCVQPLYVIAGDFSGNGWDDFAVACHSCNTVHVGLNPGWEACPVDWGTPEEFALADAPMALTWGLFGSGVGPYEKNLLVVTQYEPAWARFSVAAPRVTLQALAIDTAVHVIAEDLNADGALDVAVLDPLGLKVHFPRGGIPNINLSCLMAPGEPAFLAAADFDRDGHLDLVVAGGTSLYFFRNNRDGTFSFETELAVGLSLRGLVVADFTGNAKPDIATVDPAFGALGIVHNEGCWTFRIAQRIKMDREPVFVIALDCDRDGSVDLAVAEYAADTVTILTNDGAGTFAVARRIPVGRNPRSLAVGDFDRSGMPDLVVALHGGGPTGTGPALQIIYNPCCALDDCTGAAPCCDCAPLPRECQDPSASASPREANGSARGFISWMGPTHLIIM